MTVSWKYIRPMDKYVVMLTSPLSMFQVKILTQLYQPIIGFAAVSLYLTLVSEAEEDKHFSTENQHQWLMLALDVDLDHIYESRLRLEALGLLKSFRVSQDGETERIDYYVLPPLSVEQFFSDDILSISLYNQVGTQRYKKLRARFSLNAQPRFEQADNMQVEETTKEFHEVFTSVHASELIPHQGSEMEQHLHVLKKEYPLPDKEHLDGRQPSFEHYPVDTQLLRGYFMKGIDADQILTPVHLSEIKKVAFFYRLDEYQLSKIIQDSLNADDELQVAAMQEKAKMMYRFRHGAQPPQIIDKIQPLAHRVFADKQNMTEEERHLYNLERISPLQLLEEYQGGGKVAEADVKLVEELLFEYSLQPGVINLLIEYILMTNEFKLPKNLVTKVAAHWKRLNITDVRQAQDLAKKEHQQYKEWKEKRDQTRQETAAAQETDKRVPAGQANAKQVGKRNVNSISGQGQASRHRYRSKQQTRREQLPEWIANPPGEDDTSPISNEQKRKRIESLLKDLGEWEE